MQILLIHSSSINEPTGIVTHVCQLAALLARNGHRVRVIMRGQKDSEFKQKNVQFALHSTFYKFYRDVKKQKKMSEIIHCHDILSLAACFPRGPRSYIYTNHSVFADPEFHLSYLEWQNIHKLNFKTQLELKIIKLLGKHLLTDVKTIAVCNFVRDTISRIYSVPDSSIAVIYNGINIGDFQVAEWRSGNEKPFRILFLKPNDSRKGLHHLIEAMPLVLEKIPDVQLIAAGPEPEKDYRTYLMKLINKYHIAEKVFFIGKIPFPELACLYQSSDVVVMPSVYEAFPLVALEAGICGKPVIGSDVGGMDEVIVNGKTGFCVDTKDPVILAHAIVKILQNPELCRQMGEASRKRITEEFTWEKIGAEVEKIYQGVHNSNINPV